MHMHMHMHMHMCICTCVCMRTWHAPAQDLLVVDFVATADGAQGEQLSFDYGVAYWLYRPHPEGDTRNFSDHPRYRQRPPELALLHPPPVGTVLPLTPLTALELQARPAGCLLPAHCPLLTAHCSLLTAHCALLYLAASVSSI